MRTTPHREPDRPLAPHCCPGREFRIPAKALRMDKLTGVLRFFDLNFFWPKTAPELGGGPAVSIADNEG
jgi:hypothetical protein